MVTEKAQQGFWSSVTEQGADYYVCFQSVKTSLWKFIILRIYAFTVVYLKKSNMDSM